MSAGVKPWVVELCFCVCCCARPTRTVQERRDCPCKVRLEDVVVQVEGSVSQLREAVLFLKREAQELAPPMLPAALDTCADDLSNVLRDCRALTELATRRYLTLGVES